MKDTAFKDADLELSMLGNDRRAIVRSDILLYLPQISSEPIHFYEENQGRITELETKFETNPIYPWLDNTTFNKWFVPDSETSILSQLPIEKANIYDFRKKLFDELLNFLADKNLLTLKPTDLKIPHQSQFEQHSCHFVTGLTCSGKTTIATYLIEEYDFLHIEASDFMHEIYRENYGVEGIVEIGKFAK